MSLHTIGLVDKTDSNFGKVPSTLDSMYSLRSDLQTTKEVAAQLVHIPTQLHTLEPTRALARFTLEHLSDAMHTEVKQLCTSFGTMINMYGLTAEDLEFLLEAVPDARSECVSKYTPDREQRLAKIETFRKLLLAAENEEFPSDFNANIEVHMINLETFMTALGYTSLPSSSQFPEQLGPSWAPLKSGTPTQRLKNFVARMAQFRVAPIGSGEAYGFPTRGVEDSMEAVKKQTVKVEVFHPDLQSAASDSVHPTVVEEEHHIFIPEGLQDSLPGASAAAQKGLPERMFIGNSYVTTGLKEGVSMRAHVSGSVPLTLASMHFCDVAGGFSAKTQKEEELRLQMRAGFLTAIYECGDYHSPAETAAGVAHYHQTIANKRIYVHEQAEGVKLTNSQMLEHIPAKTFLGLAIGSMTQIVASKHQDEFAKIADRVLSQVNQ